jgi:hypothetical protein
MMKSSDHVILIPQAREKDLLLVCFQRETARRAGFRRAPSKVARKPFVFNAAIGRGFHSPWWAEGPCDTQHDIYVFSTACHERSLPHNRRDSERVRKSLENQTSLMTNKVAEVATQTTELLLWVPSLRSGQAFAP